MPRFVGFLRAPEKALSQPTAPLRAKTVRRTAERYGRGKKG